MQKKMTIALMTCLALAACSSNDKPRIIQASSDMQEVRVSGGMATQIELPNSGRVQSVIVGNSSLLSADKDGNVVNLLPKSGSGETNVIVRAVDEDGQSKVYQYRVVVQDH